MKKVLVKILALSFIYFFNLPVFAQSQMKNNTSITLSATPNSKDENDHVSYDGSYALFESTMEDKYTTLGGKFYYRLSAAENTDEEKQKLDIKRAYAKVRPFGNDLLELAIGKLYSYYLPGAYFSLTETYTGASRWGKTGVGAKTEYKGFMLGAALPVTESSVAFKTNWGVNGALSYDFSHISKKVPVTIGATVLYWATNDGNSDVSSVSKKDFSECFSLYYSSRNVMIFKSLAVFLAFSHTYNYEAPYVANTVFKPVKNYSDPDLKNANLFSFAFRPVIGSVRITSESEIGHSIEGNMIPFYSALQVQFPVYDEISLKLLGAYYAAIDAKSSSNSFDTWEIYPRILLEMNKWTFTAGWDLFYTEIADNEYAWKWTVPLSIKLKVGN